VMNSGLRWVLNLGTSSLGESEGDQGGNVESESKCVSESDQERLVLRIPSGEKTYAYTRQSNWKSTQNISW
jgi:hypothetical protein